MLFDRTTAKTKTNLRTNDVRKVRKKIQKQQHSVQLSQSQLADLQIFVQLTLMLKEIPLRTQNLQDLAFGKTLFFNQKTRRFSIQFANFKSIRNQNLSPFSVSLTEETSHIIEDFITLIRPMLKPHKSNKYLFITPTRIDSTRSSSTKSNG
jgi:hypothetical protein